MSSPTGRPSSRARKPPASTIGFESLSPHQNAQLERLTAAILEEMAAAWHAGQPSPAESWLARHPDVAAEPQAAVRIIFEEVCLREEQGQQVASAEVYSRFPQWKDALEVVLDCHELMRDQPGEVIFPEAGECLGELQLLRELGRGGQGRVFLCTQPSLCDRPLVVKLTPRTGDEHLSLARLQHTHIAPLYLVQDFPEENLRALCMPYLGGASWSCVLQTLKRRPLGQRSGREIVTALEADTSDTPPSLASGGPALGFLARSGYVEAVCWIGSALADALHYAHQRGLVHLDIKPSNVLLAADGQPMLLDFHLAREVVPAGHPPIDRLGGTRGYMSHEQELATAAVRDGQPLTVALDGRSDIYSLGVLLYESLAGTLPPVDELTSRRALRYANPEVSRGLEDIIHKCLARDPAARYADAGQLGADLRRHLAAMPLRGVPNRSRQERWQKWRRRNPHALVMWTSGLVATVVVLTAGLLFHRERVREGRLALVEAQQAFQAHDYADAIKRAAAGGHAIRWFPWQRELKQSLATRLTAARRAQLADALHKLVVQLGFVDQATNLPPAKLRELTAACDKIWGIRQQLAPRQDIADRDEVEGQLETDWLDLALLWSRLRVRVAAADERDDQRRAAAQVLDDVQKLCGANTVVSVARRQYASEADPDAELTDPTANPRTEWDHCALGRLLLQAEQFERARAEFEEAIRMQANGFWQHFYVTQCAYRLGDYENALIEASVCVALKPASAECYYNRALCHEAVGHSNQALADLARAVELDPSSSAAAYHQMAVVHLAHQDDAAARNCLERALKYDPAYAPALSLKERLDALP